MEAIYLKGNNNLPKVILDKKNGEFEISGNSNHKDADKYFETILNWIEEYKNCPLKETIFQFKLNYYNTISSMLLFQLLIKLQHLTESGNNVIVKWFFQEGDIEIKEVGLEFKEIFQFNIKMIQQ